MKEPVWVLPAVAVAVHQILIADHGGLAGVRDTDLLGSALNRPRQQHAYTDDVSLTDLAAAYCYGLASNHPFVDGNKRSALTIAGLFLELNGLTLTASEPDAVLVIEKLAAGKMSESELAGWIRENHEIHAI